MQGVDSSVQQGEKKNTAGKDPPTSGSRQVSRILNGSIIGLALVVALEAHPPRAQLIGDRVSCTE